MAATNFTPISLYYTTTAAAAPVAGNLVNGELAINITDGKLYYKNSSNVVTLLASSSGASGDVVGPASATDNALARFDLTTGKLIQNSVGILSDAGILTGLTGLTSSGSITFSSLTSGRVPYATTAGLLTDSANLLYSGTDLTVYGVRVGRGGGAVASNTVLGGNTPLNSNTTGTNNTAIGDYAGQSSTGSFNTLLGSQAGFTVTGSSNLLAGYQAGNNATFSGSFNVGLGQQALFNNTTASNNTAVGYQAGYTNSTGTQGVFIGYKAGFSSNADDCTYIGYNTANLATGVKNTVVGSRAVEISSSGTDNAIYGFGAGNGLTSGSFNTLIGRNAGSAITSGGKNSILGYYSGNSGGLDIRTASNYIVLSDGDGNPRQIIDSSGNLGLGVTPSAWTSGFKAMQMGANGSFYADGTGTYWNNNWFINSSLQSKYLTTNTAQSYEQAGGKHAWYIAPSGTAGDTITFTQAMTLFSDGNLTIGDTNSGSRLNVVTTAATITTMKSTAANGGYLTFSNGSTVPLFVGFGSTLVAGLSTSDGALRYSNNLVFGSGSSEKMRLDINGNVGIGTISPAYKLEVAGTIYTNNGSADNLLSINGDGAIKSGVQFKANGGGPYTTMYFDNSTNNTYYKNLAGGGHLFYNGATQAMTLDASGNLSVGTTSAFARLTTSTSAGSAGQVNNQIAMTHATATTGYYISTIRGASTNEPEGLTFKENATERMRIDSAGDVLIGTTSSTTWNGGTTKRILAVSNANSGDANSIITLKTNASSVDHGGILEAYAISVTSGSPALGSIGFVRENASNTALSSMTTFFTNTAGTVSEKARISSNGFAHFKGSATSYFNSTGAWHSVESTTADDTFLVFNNNANPYGVQCYFWGAAPNNSVNYFYSALDTSATRFRVYSNGGIANYQANDSNLSDSREKKNIELAPNYLDKICQIPVKTFLYNDQTDTDLNLGVIAQDVEAVCPELIVESNWASKDKEPKMRKSIYQTDLQYALMKCIQEQQALIESLTTRLTALENK